MSKQQTGYRTSVWLLAFVFSIPFVAVGALLVIALSTRFGLHIPLPVDGLPYMIRSFGKRTDFPNQISVPYWNEAFADFEVFGRKSSRQHDHFVSRIDPETGRRFDREFALTSGEYLQLRVAADRLFLVGQQETHERIDGAWQKSSLDMSTPKSWWNAQPLLWKGELVYVRQTPGNDYPVVHFAQGVWQTIGKVTLPKAIPSTASAAKSQDVSLRCFGHGEQIHMFCKLGDELFYREGLVVESELPVTTDMTESLAINEDPSSQEALGGWTRFQRSTTLAYDSDFVGMMIEGQPAIMIIEGILSSAAVGRVYRFDGDNWIEFASISLPLGSHAFRGEPTTDGMRSHVLVSTSIGAIHTYLIDSTGVRKTHGLTNNYFPFPIRVAVGCLVSVAMALGDALLLGMLHALSTAFLMRRHTSPDYAFGRQTVKLASLTWRGLARLIDLTLIALTTAAFVWLLTVDFDWLSLFEALNMRIDHPILGIAKRIALFVTVCLLVQAMALVVMQAIWGITPGKWLCRLRTVRSSLRRCSLSASLTRELLIFVDCASGLCWTPGIVSIALTDQRKRLGDLIADTIVIESRSLSSPSN